MRVLALSLVVVLFSVTIIISSDGKIATNLHVIEGLRHAGVELASGEKYDSFSVLAFDPRKDIAIIKIPGFDLPTVPLGNSNSVQVGEPVLVVGSPLGLQGSVTTGVVSSIRDDPANGGFKVMQTDASVNPGNSGGPMVNRQSEVIGIVTFKIRGSENLNFAIPVNYLRGLMESPASAMSLDELRLKVSNAPETVPSPIPSCSAIFSQDSPCARRRPILAASNCDPWRWPKWGDAVENATLHSNPFSGRIV